MSEMSQQGMAEFRNHSQTGITTDNCVSCLIGAHELVAITYAVAGKACAVCNAV